MGYKKAVGQPRWNADFIR